ncbi:MAG: tyrosine-type recombinase/integrase [Candidatus Eremiobacteraeota bacterium]|nr:tyrosine-type recombinase/integrase [Candidatus Eremiobacteraeota bacterium]
MFEQLFTNPRAVERYARAALVEERVHYLAYCAGRGSTRSSLRLIAQQQLVLINYLQLRTAESVTVEQIEQAADRWVHRQPQPHTHNAVDWRWAKGRFISEGKKWLSFLGRLRTIEGPLRPYAYLIEEFADHMLREKGLSQHTVRIRCWQVSQFLQRFWERHQAFEEVTIADIDAAVARKGDQDGYARTSIQSYINALRAFFYYAEQRGWCRPGLAAAIMSVHLFADEGLPKGPAWSDVQLLLASLSEDHPKDIRDHAIILLFAVYGMRVAEVRGLKLDDLDWGRELIYLTRPKPRRRQCYPLSHTVGESILRYLKKVRPRIARRELFLTVKAPFQPLGGGALYDLVGDRLRRLDVPLPHYGPHSLRHACATRLLAEGLSMKEIGDHLGHRKADTTRVYAKVDLAGLRQVGDFDLGDLL